MIRVSNGVVWKTKGSHVFICQEGIQGVLNDRIVRKLKDEWAHIWLKAQSRELNTFTKEDCEVLAIMIRSGLLSI